MLYHSVPICPDGIYQIFDTWCAVFFKNVNWLNWLNKLMGASQTGYAFIVKSPQLAKIRPPVTVDVLFDSKRRPS